MKPGQVNNILRKKRGSAATHLASYNMLAAWVVHMRKIDPEGTYILQTESILDEAGVQQWRFVYLFAGPSATQKAMPFVASCIFLIQRFLFVIMLRPLGFTNPQGIYCHLLTCITFSCLHFLVLSHPLSRCNNTSRK